MSTTRGRKARVWRVAAFTFALTLLGSILAINAFAIDGFESADGNLETDGGTDWNSLTGTTGTDWHLATFPDAVAKDDDQFSGGTKQDKDCPGTKVGAIGGGDTKFDLKRVRLGHKTVAGDEILVLSWIRVPSSPSASSHVAYEFNKGENGLCTSNNNTANPDLLKRSEGDMLIVFDFAGGDADSTVRMTRWLTAGNQHVDGDCEVSQSVLPCWGDPMDLTELGYADADVNSGGDTTDTLVNPDEVLHPVQFGEAGVNLTLAGVLDPNTCEGFGSVTAVSRSSGNSGIAQMKDKVGPGDFTLANCGSILVNKFGPDGSTLLGGATIKLTAADNVDDANDDGKFDAGEAIDPDKVITMAEGDDGVFCSDGLTFGDYVVFETAAPAGYDPDTSYNPVTLSTFSTCAGRLGDSGTSDDDDPDVEITNNPEPGRITIVKEDDDGNVLPGVQFELFNDVNENDSFDEGTDTTTGSTCTTDSEGVCQEGGAPFDDPARPAFDQVDPGFYCVVEVASSIPSGYGGADPQCVEVGVESGGDTISLTFENPRLHRVIVIVCHQGTDTLVSTEVDDGTTKKDSIASGDLPAGMDEGDLCTLGGARYNGYDDDDTPSFAADMGTAHPH